MNHNLTYDFSVDKENKTIKVKREFEAERLLVWDAYTKSKILDQWWAPKPWKAKTKTMDFREGGHWLYAMVGPEGEEHWAIVDFKQVVTQKKFTGQDAFSDSDGNINKDMPQSKWEVTFIDKGQSTIVEMDITFDDLSQLEETIEMGFKDGLATAMDGLDDLLPILKK